MRKGKEPDTRQRGLAFKKTIQDECESFLEKNPGFYDEFVRRARLLKARGYEQYSADGILHAIRFDRALVVKKEGLYRINDHLSSRLSRLVQDREPDLKGFFETRKLRAA